MKNESSAHQHVTSVKYYYKHNIPSKYMGNNIEDNICANIIRINIRLIVLESSFWASKSTLHACATILYFEHQTLFRTEQSLFDVLEQQIEHFEQMAYFEQSVCLRHH